MTKKIIITIHAIVLVAIPVFSALTPHIAAASCSIDPFNFNAMDCVYEITANISEIIMAAAGAFISLAGVLLNGVMVATLNMKDIVDSTAAIGIAWRTIRDFSSIFIIFMLLYASISMILGVKGPGLGNVIKNIVIAGLLINFSLFGTKVLIDASNILSTSFYCAMAPNSNACTGTSASLGAFSSTGISNVFMQSLDIQAAITDGTSLQKEDVPLTITLGNLGASVLMVAAGLSFITAAIMFAIRIAILILLMAFSPIYCIAIMLPGTEVSSYAKKWSGAFKSMCIFMPVYLFLMYIAVSIINDASFFNFAKVPAQATTGLLDAKTISIILQYIIAFIMINAPLLAAISIAGEGAKFVNSMTDSVKKWGQGAISGGWRETGGRAMSKLSENEGFRNLAARSTIAEFAFKGAKASSATYDKKLDKQVKSRTEFAESLGYDRNAVGKLESRKNASERLATLAKDELAKAKRNNSATDIAYWTPIVATRKARLDADEAEVKKEKNKRTNASVKKSRGGSLDTMFLYTARKDKVAAAKLETKLKEEDKKKQEDKLKDKKGDIKKLEDAANKVGGEANLTPLQIKQLTDLRQERADHQNKIANLENEINDLKTTT